MRRSRRRSRGRRARSGPRGIAQRETGGQRFQMRMVFRDVTADSLRWEWQRSDDDWATAAPMIAIDYRRTAR